MVARFQSAQRRPPLPQTACRRARRMVAVSCLALVTWNILAAAPPSDTGPIAGRDGEIEAAGFMQAKLASSQRVLEGLVVENFELIRKGARQMKKMSEAAQWPRAPDEVYDHFSEEFRRSAAKLEHLAKARNLEGASYTYMHMTSVCISCHKYVRRSFRVADDQAAPGAVRLIPSEWPD